MKNLYKICICLVISLLTFVFSFSNARLDTDKKEPEAIIVKDPKISGNVITGTIEEGTDYETNKLQGILQFPERSEYATPLGYALRLIQISINWILGILATVALVYMLYCGFLIFFSGADSNNVKKGTKGISTAAIALAGIGLSWLIVSAMLWFIGIVSKVK